jgi:hypothetical protein
MQPFYRAIPSACVAALMFGSQVGPSDAELNLCKWPKLFFVGVPDHCLAGMSSETFYLVTATAFILTAIWGLRPLASARMFQSPKPLSASGWQSQTRDLVSPSIISQASAAPLKIECDVWLSDAMWRAFLGFWGNIPNDGVLSFKITESEKQRFAMLIIGEFRQRAFDGELPVWGRRKDSSILEPVPRNFWASNQIDHIAVATASHPDEVKACAQNPLAKPDTSGDWHYFMTSKAVIEQLYPSQK